jgi:hypothetical protein
VAKAVRQIARLEARPFTTPHDHKVCVGRHRVLHRVFQFFVSNGLSVVEQLNFQAIAGPIQLCGRARDTNRQRTFLTDRQLHDNGRKIGIRKRGRFSLASRAKPPQQRQPKQLKGQERQKDQHKCQDNLEEQGKTGHGEKFGPPSSLWRAIPNCRRDGV